MNRQILKLLIVKIFTVLFVLVSVCVWGQQSKVCEEIGKLLNVRKPMSQHSETKWHLARREVDDDQEILARLCEKRCTDSGADPARNLGGGE